MRQNHRKAVKWYRKATEQGLAIAQYHLGTMYANGQGVAKNYTEAMTWVRKAAEQGFAPAQFSLGAMYEYGQGAAQDYAEALKWYHEAAQQGDPSAQTNLGAMYASGRGVRQNLVTAYMWLSLSAAAGDKLAAKTKNTVAQHMTPEQIAEAQRLAHEWREKRKQPPEAPGMPHSGPKIRSYSHPVYRWSISYPSDWTLNAGDPGPVLISYKNKGLCGVHTAAVPFKTVDEFTDFMLKKSTKLLLDKGLLEVVSLRRQISLPNDIVGNDVLVDLVPGGRDRRIFVMAGGRGFIINCEADIKNWKTLDPTYDSIIRSFTVAK